MINLKKNRADDYLYELVSPDKEVWLLPLIEAIIQIRSVPNADFIEDIFSKFMVSYKLKKTNDIHKPQNTPIRKIDKSYSDIVLENIRHDNGVNALEEDTTIPFNPKLTVIYGKNGSGKSGFVRIFKRIAGSKTQEEIWQNIHNKQTRNICKANIEYLEGSAKRSYCWNGENNIAPLNKMTIFDGKCIPFYLNKSSDFSYQPYGFELFHALSISLQELQKRLNMEISKAEGEKPLIADLFNKESSAGKFVASISSNTKIEDLSKVPAWGPKAQKDLKEKIELRKKLLSLDQQSELLTVRYQKVRALENTLIKIQAELSAKNINFYSDLIKEFCLLKEKRLSTKEKTLQNYHIPGVKIAEWEGFIRAGENYISSLQSENHSEYDEYCIYCRQRLTTTSKKLVDLYRELSKNEKTSDYSKISVKINDIVSSLDRIFYRDNFPYLAEDFDKIINKKLIATALITMVNGDNLIHEIKEGFNNLRLKKIGPPKITGIINKIRKSKIKIEADIEKLKDDRINYSTRIRELDSRIIELQDVHAFSLNKSKLEKYILIKGWVEKALALQANKFSTKPITDLAKKAWKEMVSDSFVECFKNEATNLRAPTVKLEFRGEYGSQIREKSLDGLNEIDKFLSEGEQKAVALADLFSELAMRHEKTPVIFDDPATSFDYDRKKIIAERIIKESDSRQIIVFTHDLVFTSYLYDKVLDKNGKIDTSKANFHNMHAEDNKVGLITENYYPGSTKFDDDIQKIDSRVLHLESLSGEELDDGIRSLYSKLRRAVEKAVEERIFGGIITRWTDRIQMFNIPKASLNKGKLDKARSLHDKFCSFTDAHYQSNEAAQHFTLSISNLKDDIQNVKDIAIR